MKLRLSKALLRAFGRCASEGRLPPAAALRRREKAGFTLIELLLVVVIIGILAAIIAPRLIGRSDEARSAAARGDLKVLSNQLAAYEIDSGTFPTTGQGLAALLLRPTSQPQPKNWKGPYLDEKELPKDPWGNDYLYAYPGQRNLNGYDLWSFGPDGQDGTEDDIER